MQIHVYDIILTYSILSVKNQLSKHAKRENLNDVIA